MKDSRNDKEYSEFNIGDEVMVVGNIGYYHEIVKGKILYKNKNWFNTYDYIVEGFPITVDITRMNMQKYDEEIFNQLKELEEKMINLDRQKDLVYKKFHKLIPHQH